MDYKELIHFEPITSVVKLVNAGELAIAEGLVKTFVFSKKMQEDMQEVIIKNLVPNPAAGITALRTLVILLIVPPMSYS